MKKLGAIVTVRGKGNYINIGAVNLGELVQVSWSDNKDDELTSEGTFEVDNLDELKKFVTDLAKVHSFVLVSIQ